MPKQIITNLSKGELGPELYGRIDTPQYSAGAKRARNFIVQRYGGLAFRPGFRFVADADDVETPIRYFPFENSLDYAYVLAATEGSFRPLALGGSILEDNLRILSITQESQAILEVAYHAMAVGDRFFLDGIEGMAELNGRFGVIVAIVDASHVRTDIDTSAFEPFTSSDGTSRSGAPAPPPPAPTPPPPAPPSPPPPVVGGGGGNVDPDGPDTAIP
jgi:hypothetical protein